jgi:hypothetical protein
MTEAFGAFSQENPISEVREPTAHVSFCIVSNRTMRVGDTTRFASKPRYPAIWAEAIEQGGSLQRREEDRIGRGRLVVGRTSMAIARHLNANFAKVGGFSWQIIIGHLEK